jgi:hypothetical protein
MQPISLLLIALVAGAFASPVAAQLATSGPILPDERTTTEPPRAVPAPDYRDAYCATWTDGCSICQRKVAGGEASCQPVGGNQAACERQPVECRAPLKSIGRVCLSYTDGCNQCTGGSCTAMACMTRPLAGTPKQKETNIRCTAPRRTRYDDPQLLRLDLRGH